jgi:beta-aspartyl-peptidase (threonine type)
MDAAVAAVKCVEDNRDDHGVGNGGIPNVLGQVELDASVMDGRAQRAPSPPSGLPSPIEIARKVMETTPRDARRRRRVVRRRHSFKPPC